MVLYPNLFGLGDRMESLKRTIAAHKGHLTRELNAVIKLVQFARANPSPRVVKDMEDTLEGLRRHHKAVMEGYLELAVLTVDPADQVVQDKKMEVVETDFLQAVMDVQAALVAINMPAAPSVVAPPALSRGGAGAASQWKVQTALQPEKLTRESTPAEMRAWARKFRAFYSTSNLSRAQLEDQQAFFLSYLDLDLETTIRESIDVTTAIFGAKDSCREFLEQKFRVTYPLFTRRLDYFRYCQAQGQTFAEYVAKLRQKGNKADLAALSVDEMYVFRVLSGLSDNKMKEKLLELKSPSLAALIAEAPDIEVARRNLKASGASDSQARCSRQEDRRRDNRSKSRGPPAGPKCPDCGNREHEEDYPCPAASHSCHHCKKKGHFNKARGGAPICPVLIKKLRKEGAGAKDSRGKDTRKDEDRARSKARKSKSRNRAPSTSSESSSGSDSDRAAAGGQREDSACLRGQRQRRRYVLIE
jgi:hypothetical protein